MQKLTIGIFGFGTVGQALVDIIRKENLPIEIAGVVDRSHQHKKKLLAGIPSSNDFNFILNNTDVQLVIELIGGVDTALYIVREALDRRKFVITANKALLAEHGYSLFTKAKENNTVILFEAAILGALPLVKNLHNYFAYEHIRHFQGIFNGTCNYILSLMRIKKQTYETALKKAQELGFAEADSALDVEGKDTAQKLALTTSLIQNRWIEWCNIPVIGIEDITQIDIEWLDEMQLRVRLIATYYNHGSQTELHVQPTVLSKEHKLWDIENEDNAILIEAKYSNFHVFIGKGAGAYPTAYAVISDLHSIMVNDLYSQKLGYANWPYMNDMVGKELETPFYVRTIVDNSPGVLSLVSGILGQHGVSIDLVEQKCINESTNSICVFLVTHPCKLSSIKKVVGDLGKLSPVQDHVIYLLVDKPSEQNVNLT